MFVREFLRHLQRHSFIEVYLSAVQALHIEQGFNCASKPPKRIHFSRGHLSMLVEVNAYQLYIRTPSEVLATLYLQLV